MSTYRLDKLFAPRSVALVGASAREGALGRTVLTNLREAGFPGPVLLVNPKYRKIDGEPCAARIEDLAPVPDLIVITTPPAAVPRIVASAGRKGAGAAVIVTAGLGHGEASLAEAARVEARKHGLRLVGPNCLGVMAPPAKLNASFAARNAIPGDLALISQSGAVAAGLIEWAARRQVGFSGLVSLGDMVDVDFGDCLDYFAADRGTRAILLYIEAVADARKFMSAARAAARTKPVVVIKSGRHAQGARAAATHTGALAGSHAFYEAAFRRAGLLRVFDLDELFAAAETLGRQKPFPGKRLAILTNGGGVRVLAVDRLIDLGGTLAAVSPDAMAKLDRALPPTWSRANPVDIIGDADAARYGVALEALLADEENDAILVLNVPTALASASQAAEAVAETVRRDRQTGAQRKPVFAVWLGEDEVSKRAFEEFGLPHFATEADAVRGFMHLVRYREAQDLMMETPDSLPRDFAPDAAAARRIVADVLREGRQWLDPLEANRLLAAYDIPVAPVTLAASPEEAAAALPIFAEGGSVAVKILSPDILHKSDVGGVKLDLTSADAVRKAAADIFERAGRLKPGARVAGVTVQAMVRRPKARELIAGLANDPTFGPVVVFGRGGTAVEIIDDKSMALPPLDLKLAEMLIARTQVSRILKAYRDVPAADERAIRLLLVKLSQLAADVSEIRELDINPFLADQNGVIAVDARVRVLPETQTRRGAGHRRFAVRPYPKEWERSITLKSGRKVFVRPVRPEDEELFVEFLKHVSSEDLRLRFFAPVREFSHAFLARLIQTDYARALAFLALDAATGEMIGVVRLHADANHETAEYAILLRSDLKGQGLGWELMQLIIEWAKADGLSVVEGQVLRENAVMLEMASALGFEIRSDASDRDLHIVTLRLEDAHLARRVGHFP